jgi:2-amino-4-hydroxy-6-hydroxymethyldihydropteridine diphosphokinase
MTPAFIALGSNVEPRLNYLTAAIHRLQALGKIIAIAPLYRSSAYGVEDQADFLNSACILNTNFLALDLLNSLKDIEEKLGRKKRFRWGPREIDLDIIFYDKQVIEKDKLVIPHQDYKNRIFVIKPLCDLDANFIPPGEDKNLAQLLAECTDKTQIKLEAENWWDG